MSENNFTVKFTHKANEDIEEIFNYISGKLFAEVVAVNLFCRAYMHGFWDIG
jgi:hypothetical protein